MPSDRTPDHRPPGSAQHADARAAKSPLRWTRRARRALFALPFPDLLFRAQEVHRAHHAPNAVQLSTLFSIKTGGCPEDCGYCPQAARYHTGVDDEAMLDLDDVVAAARAAKAAGATRFCMGAAWRGPKDRDLEPVLAMVREVKALGLETCCTLGMLKDGQAERAQATRASTTTTTTSTPRPNSTARSITTRDYQDRLDTLERVRDAGINVCCGGIVGMGESRAQRAGLIAQLANMDPLSGVGADQPPRAGRGHAAARRARRRSALDPLEFVRTIAVARITMPKAMVRLSAGRRELGEAVQALCFLAGANSIFYGDKLLTTGNPDVDADRSLFAKLGLTPAT